MKLMYAVAMIAVVALACLWAALAIGQATTSAVTEPSGVVPATMAASQPAYNPPPEVVPARITYTDPATGRQSAISGELLFDAWPVQLGGRPTTIDKWELVHYHAERDERFHPWMRQVEPDVFVISSLRAVWRVKFNFDNIPVLSAGATRPAGATVAFRTDVTGAPQAISVSAIREIDMIQITWNPFTRKR